MSQSDWNNLIKDLETVTERMKTGSPFEGKLQRLGSRASSIRMKRQSERTQAILSKSRT